MKIFRIGWGLVAVLLGLLLSPVTGRAQELVFGVFPYLSPRQMNEIFAPLRDHLGQALGRPVQLRSAPDYKTFIERTGAGEYDLIFNAPQLARLAQKRDGYQPLAQTGYRIQIVVVARKDGPVRSLLDLRGQSISIGARTSLTHQIMRDELRKAGLQLDKDVHYLDTAYFSNVLQAVIRGDAAAGATGTSLWDSAPQEERNELRIVFTQKDPTPGFILVAHPRLGEAVIRRLRDALLDFREMPAGRQYFEKTKQIDFRPVDEATMRSLDPYTEIYRKP